MDPDQWTAPSRVGAFVEAERISRPGAAETAEVRQVMMRPLVLTEIGDSEDLRDWIECLAYPVTDLLEEDGVPSWHAQFAAQVVTDPTLREIAVDETTTPTNQRFLLGFERCLPDLTDASCRSERESPAMSSSICAERERALADGNC